MPRGNRLTNMLYDEVSVVDAGANNDDVEGAHVVLAKRATKITAADIADFSPVRKSRTSDGGGSKKSSSSSSSSSSKKKGTTQRAANWDEARHPRIKGGPGGGEFSSTSAASKKKYGKGGTAIDNLPQNDRTTNKTATKLGLEHGITAAQRSSLSSVSSDKGGTGPSSAQKKAASAAKKADRAKKKQQSAEQRKLRQQVSTINGLAANQRGAYRKSGKPIPKGYEWNSNNRLVSSASVAAKNKLASSLGLPAAQTTGSKKKKSSSSKSSTKMQMVMDSKGHISWKAVPSSPAPKVKPAKKTTAKKKKSKKRKRGKVKKNVMLNKWLYGERSATS